MPTAAGGLPGGRAQAALFDGLGSAGRCTGYDEFVDAADDVGPHGRAGRCIGDRGRTGWIGCATVVRGLVDDDGITYVEATARRRPSTERRRHRAPGPWQLDPLPLLIVGGRLGRRLEAGLVQRSDLLDAVLTDLYGPQTLITQRNAARPSCSSNTPTTCAPRTASGFPVATSCSSTAATSSRGRDGEFRVIADRTQAPSGAGYAMADRRVVSQALPDLSERSRARAELARSPTALRLALDRRRTRRPPRNRGWSCSARAPTPRPRSTRPILASVLGLPLVESADLMVRDGRLWMRSLGTLERGRRGAAPRRRRLGPIRSTCGRTPGSASSG